MRQITVFNGTTGPAVALYDASNVDQVDVGPYYISMKLTPSVAFLSSANYIVALDEGMCNLT